MLYVVEVRLISDDLLTRMADMRTWLDHLKIQPDSCRYSKGTPASTVRLEFKTEDHAVRFAKAFGGRLLGAAAQACSASEDAIASDGYVPVMG